MKEMGPRELKLKQQREERFARNQTPTPFEDAARGRDPASKSSDGGVEGHAEHASRSEWGGGSAQVKTASAVSVPAKAGRVRDDGGASPSARKRAQGSAPSVEQLQAGIKPSPPEAKLKRGRPRITEQRPWQAAGISRSSWYRQKEKK